MNFWITNISVKFELTEITFQKICFESHFNWKIWSCCGTHALIGGINIFIKISSHIKEINIFLIFKFSTKNWCKITNGQIIDKLLFIKAQTIPQMSFSSKVLTLHWNQSTNLFCSENQVFCLFLTTRLDQKCVVYHQCMYWERERVCLCLCVIVYSTCYDYPN